MSDVISPARRPENTFLVAQAPLYITVFVVYCILPNETRWFQTFFIFAHTTSRGNDPI